MRRTAAETREHVLGVANDLFYWHGIRATGVDRIADEAAVAPTTLYRLFASKDDLVAAYIERAHLGYRQWFADAIAAGKGPREQILSLFDALTEQVQPGQCRGCPFLMALAEFPDPDSAPHRNAVAMKTWVREQFGVLAAAFLGSAPADVLADQLALTMEGVYASVQALGVDGPARQARALVELLLTTPE